MWFSRFYDESFFLRHLEDGIVLNSLRICKPTWNFEGLNKVPVEEDKEDRQESGFDGNKRK